MPTQELPDQLTPQAILDKIGACGCDVTERMRGLAAAVAEGLHRIGIGKVGCCSDAQWATSLAVRQRILDITGTMAKPHDSQDTLDLFAVHAAVSMLLGYEGDTYCAAFREQIARRKKKRAMPDPEVVL